VSGARIRINDGIAGESVPEIVIVAGGVPRLIVAGTTVVTDGDGLRMETDRGAEATAAESGVRHDVVLPEPAFKLTEPAMLTPKAVDDTLDTVTPAVVEPFHVTIDVGRKPVPFEREGTIRPGEEAARGCRRQRRRLGRRRTETTRPSLVPPPGVGL
jgi:hypothetical protein